VDQPIAAPLVKPAAGRSPLQWVAIGCGGLLVLGVVFGAVLFFFVSGVTGPAKTAGDGFMGALRDGNYQAAYDMGSPGFQKDAVSVANLQRVVEGGGVKPTEWSFNSTNVDGDTGAMDGTATVAGGKKASASVSVVKVDGVWKVSSFDLKTL
jgi:hypothetical protein